MPELGDALLRHLDCFAAVLGCFVIGTRWRLLPGICVFAGM